MCQTTENFAKLASYFRGPCFFAQNFYHGVIDFAFTQSDYHDRYYNTNIAQRHVPDN